MYLISVLGVCTAAALEAFQNKVQHRDEEGYKKQDDVQNKDPLPTDLGCVDNLAVVVV